MSTTAVIEAGLVAAAAGGDVSAFGRVVDAYRATVCSIALAIVRDVPTSEDVAQDVFVAAWDRLAELRDPRSLGPWLRQVTRNRARDVLRRRRHEAPVDPARTDAHDDRRAGDPARAMLDTEAHEILDAALDDLPDDAREILLLFYREGRSIRQVASLLELSEVATKKRLSRARARLREDVLARFADVARDTGPKAAFTTAVVAAVTAGSPSIAAAATGGVLATGSKIAKLVAFGGAALGAVLGVAGVLFGMRRLTRRARSGQERARLDRVTAVSVVHVIGLCVVIIVLSPWRHEPAVMWSWYAALVAGLAAIHLVWIPQIIEPRLAAERRDDPTAASRQRRERWLGILGMAVGALASALGVTVALYRG